MNRDTLASLYEAVLLSIPLHILCNEAGQCLVMQAQMAGRKLIMVLLDSAGKYSRIADAERIRKWITSTHTAPVPTARAATDAG